jgi:uncharacterized protein YqeY
MEKKIQNDIMSAMKSKDEITLKTLRGVKTAIMQYKTSSTFKGDRDALLSDGEVIKIMQKLAKERKETAEVYKNAGRTELSEQELAEANIIEKYLPQAMSENEVEELVKASIVELGATSIKEMGLVIKDVNAKANGRTDGKTISTIVKRLLS